MLARIYEEEDVGPEMRRLYGDVRAAFDLPFVPTLFKVLAGAPDYLKLMWRDVAPVASSREFHSAVLAFDEVVRSAAIGGGWSFRNQERVMAEQKIALSDMPVLAGVVGVFARELPSIVLFSRLIQRGYGGGQPGRVSSAKQAPALSRLMTLHVSSDHDSSLRVWLLYSEIRRALGTRNVPGVFRALAPFPGYLASAWLEAKRLFDDEGFMTARDNLVRRAAMLISGLPVQDHRQLAKNISQEQWRVIEQTVDSYAHISPQLALLCAVWRRSFALTLTRSKAA
ncbi:MAG TPA: halocarboxylic acid dehydrogenase DehI family protein [Candidatus Acidoferrales bacterium]|nr:halocarboxylic acid dehydrogenase DehI family protein [Candidatus Acidoferrales bacterium]